MCNYCYLLVKKMPYHQYDEKKSSNSSFREKEPEKSKICVNYVNFY